MLGCVISRHHLLCLQPAHLFMISTSSSAPECFGVTATLAPVGHLALPPVSNAHHPASCSDAYGSPLLPCPHHVYLAKLSCWTAPSAAPMLTLLSVLSGTAAEQPSQRLDLRQHLCLRLWAHQHHQLHSGLGGLLSAAHGGPELRLNCLPTACHNICTTPSGESEPVPADPCLCWCTCQAVGAQSAHRCQAVCAAAIAQSPGACLHLPG